MAYDVLLTGFALFAAGFAVYFAWRAGLSAEAAAHSEHRLAIMRGQVRGMEVALAALEDSHKRLAGKVHAKQWRDDRALEAPVGPDGSSRDVCENWQLAKQDGPGSKAAMCTCAYCEAMREDRARRRATVRPGVKS